MALIVEGKYDKIKLSSIVEAVIIQTDGFKVFKDEDKRNLICHYAKTKGIAILTDSDSAGFKIRNYIKGFVKEGKIVNVYIPDIFGKEKRKVEASKEGKLGVEGIKKDILIKSFEKAGIITYESEEKKELITKMDFYLDGFIGQDNSSAKRQALLKTLELPELLSTKATLEIINTVIDLNEYKKIVEKL